MGATVAACADERHLVPYRPDGHDRRMEDGSRPVPRDELEWDVEQALRKARKLLPRKREPGVFNPYRAAARAVVEHLELCRITCWRKPPLPPHGSPGGPFDEDGREREAKD